MQDQSGLAVSLVLVMPGGRQPDLSDLAQPVRLPATLVVRRLASAATAR